MQIEVDRIIMAKQLINIGSSPNSRDGDTTRAAFIKVNGNFGELYEAVELLGYASGSDGIVSLSVKGDLYSADGTLLIDSATGKLTNAVVPDNVPMIYEFRVNFNQSGNLDSVLNLPDGWQIFTAGNLLTVVHSTPRYPKVVSYWGATALGDYRLRYPSAGYQVIRPIGDNTRFTLNLNAAVTGADYGQHALVTVMF